jgi:preprotein translocase subunit SecY
VQKLLTIFYIPELRRKILFTLVCLAIYRIGYYIPLPIIDQAVLQQKIQNMSTGAFGQIMGFVSMFSGGNLSNASIIALGIMPYISASIIFQLLASFWAPLEKLQKEGESGRKKINEYTRYATVPICMVQAWFVYRYLAEPEGAGGMGVVYSAFTQGFNYYLFGLSSVVIMTAGTVFLMWLGEQIDEYGIGNGISLIIMAGIIGRIPDATSALLYDPTTGQLRKSILTLGGGTGSDIGFEKLLVLVALFIGVVVSVIAITKGQRRIPTQSAKHVRGRRVYGGTRQFLPLKVNQAGVMPVIFAGSMVALVMVPLRWLGNSGLFTGLAGSFERQGFMYNLVYIAMIYFFCYFWTAITFNPKDMANNLKDYGSFIPGYRPGKRTADYLEKVLMRITYVGAAFLAIIAIIPSIIQSELNVDWRVASFYGGTGLLIVVSVALDLVQKINSHLVMRNYPGLTED